VWPWLKFFTCKSKEEFDMLASKYPELEGAVYCAKRMSIRKFWRQFWFGVQIGKYAIAKKLKARGRPLSEIVEDTGLSAEAVEKL
jgi:hypothetical protein